MLKRKKRFAEVSQTELTPRKQAVLAAVVKAYIDTGEPVGSKSLVSMLENSPSSATLRNEMNELCSLGLLKQPHTSAGRVPTSMGYRIYINRLMKPDAVSPSTKRFIDSALPQNGIDAQSIPTLAANALSALTGLPAIICDIAKSDLTLKRVELIRLGRKSAILLFVTSDGRMNSRICRLSDELTPDLQTRFDEIVYNRLRNVRLCDINPAKLQNIIAASGLDCLMLMPLFTALFDMIGRISNSSVRLVGGDKLYNICNEYSVQRILSLVQRGEPLTNLLSKQQEPTQVIFGNDTPIGELDGKAIAFSSYKIGDSLCGRIGIIGTGRMSYEQIIPTLEYTAQRVSRLMTDALTDLED